MKIPINESLMDFLTSRMDISAKVKAVRNLHRDDFAPPPPELRLPLKHFESGRKLQSRILVEIAGHMPRSQRGLASKAKLSLDSRSIPEVAQLQPSITPLFDSIKASLSAFDKSECETALWTNKYAPRSAVEVLQPGREAFMLKDWLHALEVQSVQTGTGEGEKGKKGKTAAPKKKKKKKTDDFIVSSGGRG